MRTIRGRFAPAGVCPARAAYQSRKPVVRLRSTISSVNAQTIASRAVRRAGSSRLEGTKLVFQSRGTPPARWIRNCSKSAAIGSARSDFATGALPNCLEAMLVSTCGCRFDHRAALVRLGDDPVSVPLVIELYRAPRPFDRREFARSHPRGRSLFCRSQSGDDDSGFIRTFADRDRGSTATTIRRIGGDVLCLAGPPRAGRGPQRPLDVLEQFGVELLAAESRAFVSA